MDIKVIAVNLGITQNLAAKALDSWYEQRGMAKPDGRSRRATLTQKHVGRPLYMQLAEDAMRMSNEGHPFEEIGVSVELLSPHDYQGDQALASIARSIGTRWPDKTRGVGPLPPGLDARR